MKNKAAQTLVASRWNKTTPAQRKKTMQQVRKHKKKPVQKSS